MLIYWLSLPTTKTIFAETQTSFITKNNMCDGGHTIKYLQTTEVHTQVWYDIIYNKANTVVVQFDMQIFKAENAPDNSPPHANYGRP